MRREWIDSQSARIVLDDGKVVLLTLTAHIVPGADIDGLIVVSVDDPEVSAWEPEAILAAARLEDGWSCWTKHWDDDALLAKAVRLAHDAAIEACDFASEDFELPEGLSPLQRSESVLHWAVKELLAELCQVGVEAYSERVAVTVDSGTELVDYATVPNINLVLSEVRIEQRLGEVIPDIICQARDPSGHVPDMELLIEVAVTNTVSPAKRQRLLDLGIACIELDVGRLPIQGPVTRAALSKYLRVSFPCVWVNAPFMGWIASDVEKRLEQQAEALRHEREERAEEERHFSALSSLEVVQVYLDELQLAWARSGTKGQVASKDSAKLRRLGLAILALQRLGYTCANDHVLTLDRGLLWQLLTVCRSKEGQSRTLRLMVEGTYEGAPERQQFISILLTAIRVVNPPLAPADREAIQVVRAKVLASIQAGEGTFARPRTYDALLALAFPRLARELEKPVGTAAHATKVRIDRLNAKWAERREVEEQRRQSNAEVFAARAAADREMNLKQAYKRISELQWAPTNQVPLTVDFCLRRVRPGSRGDIDAHSFLRAAWTAREEGQVLRHFLETSKPNDKDQLDTMIGLLSGAWLLESANQT